MGRKKAFNRKFENNVCDNKPPYDRVRVKLNVSIDEGTEEKLAVMAQYGDIGNASELVNLALHEFFSKPANKRKLKEVYATWEKETEN